MNFVIYFDVQKPFFKIWHVIMNTVNTTTAYHENASKRGFELASDINLDFIKSA
jgi:hypothetical protein